MVSSDPTGICRHERTSTTTDADGHPELVTPKVAFITGLPRLVSTARTGPLRIATSYWLEAITLDRADMKVSPLNSVLLAMMDDRTSFMVAIR